MILESLEIDPIQFEKRTGWAVKPEGACKAEACVPLTGITNDNGTLDALELAKRMGMPLVADEQNSLWSLGPETALSGRALSSAQAPALRLPDRHGNPFELSSLLGKKVLLVSWASW